jgi:precorrin-6Y C5,15-methyltransferase (decarboxylating)
MKPIELVSAGPGGSDFFTMDALEAIAESDVVFAARRHGVGVPPEKLRALTPFSGALEAMDAARRAGSRVAVLLSGDAGLYSMLGLLAKRFGRESLRVHPGVSALQAFCAALCESWQDACICSAHGRALSPSALCHAVRTNGSTFLFMDGERDPNWAHDILRENGLSDAEMTVAERLTYPDQRVEAYSARAYDALCMVRVRNPAPERGLPPIGIADEAFIRGNTPMTKREIRALAVTALALTPDAIVWDVGAGTGSVSVECARQCPLGEVYAIECEPEALSLIGQNKAKFHAANLAVIAGKAPEALSQLPAPTHVFLGGTGGETAAILDCVEQLAVPVNIAATAVTMESARILMERLGAWRDVSAAQVFVTRLEPVGQYKMFRGQNPVFIFSARRDGTG